MQHLIIERICETFTYIKNGSQVETHRAWDISKKYHSLDAITCGTDLVSLTSMESDATLIDWFKALGIGGTLNLTLPDADHYAKMWLSARWDESQLRDPLSDARSSFAGLFGAQTTCNPKLSNYNAGYSDCHKSAFNAKRITFLLQRVGFAQVKVEEKAGILQIEAIKTMQVGERQISTSYDNIRLDHKNRYQFACEQLKYEKVSNILDLACGIGYGTLMLAKQTGANVTGVDIDAGAIEYAKQYYRNDQTSFVQQDARKLELQSGSVDAVVSFETIEHVDFDIELLSAFFNLLKPGGILICSTPNEEVMPFSKEQFAYHVRHYTVNEITSMLEQVGFVVDKRFTQLDPTQGEIVAGDNGCFTILSCHKKHD